MKRHGNLWDRVVDPENLMLALRKAKRGKLGKASVRRVVDDGERTVERLKTLLESGEFRTAEYHTKPIFEPKLRLIYSLPFYPDRIAQHALMNVLEPIWDGLMYDWSCSCRKGKGQHVASRQCMKWVRVRKYYAQLDVSQFYVNIDHELVKSVCRRKLKDDRILAFIDEIVDSCDIRRHNIAQYEELRGHDHAREQAGVTLKKLRCALDANEGRPAGLAVGNLVSQWLGNLYLNELDMFVCHELRMGAYVRFCDDLLLFSDSKAELWECIRRMVAFAREKLRLTFHTAVVAPTTRGVDFCGYVHFHNGVKLLRKKTALRKKRECRWLTKALPCGRVTGGRLRGKLASMLGLLKHAMTHNFVCSLRVKDLYGYA